MNRMRMWVSSLAGVVCCLLAVAASAQPLPAQPPLPPLGKMGPVAPAPPAPPAGFKTLKPSEFEWAGLDAVWKNGMAWIPNDSWGWPFSQSRGQTGQTASRSASQTESMEMAFTNPNTPGTLELHLFNGSVLVKGTNRKDVSVRVTHRGGDTVFERNTPPPPAGMRRLNSGRRGSLSLEEDNNRIEVRSRSVNGEMDLEIEVPTRTNLELRVVNGGEIAVEGVEGTIEVNNVNGPVRLTNVAGSVVASSVNANVTVRLTRVSDAKAMAFSSLTGTVDVTLPATTKANLKLRSDNGDVFTDFDVQQTDSPNRSGWVRSDRGDKRVRFENNTTIYGTINGGGPEIEARSFNGSVYIRRAQ